MIAAMSARAETGDILATRAGDKHELAEVCLYFLAARLFSARFRIIGPFRSVLLVVSADGESASRLADSRDRSNRVL